MTGAVGSMTNDKGQMTKGATSRRFALGGIHLAFAICTVSSRPDGRRPGRPLKCDAAAPQFRLANRCSDPAEVLLE
jgi:hypothetical protein